MRVYKFRGLGNCQSFERASQILLTGKFWCSRFFDLNDPMEGVYSTGDQFVINNLFSDKNKYKLCSFTGEEGLKNPLMWGQYANGFKGIAIEVEVSKDEMSVVNYHDSVQRIDDCHGDRVKFILTNKLSPWKHENEYRLLKEEKLEEKSDNLQKIGEIKGVYFGAPYKNVENYDQIRLNPSLKEYYHYRDLLVGIAKLKNLDCNEVYSEGVNINWRPIQ